jgi:hypothetical protein
LYTLVGTTNKIRFSVFKALQSLIIPAQGCQTVREHNIPQIGLPSSAAIGPQGLLPTSRVDAGGKEV